MTVRTHTAAFSAAELENARDALFADDTAPAAQSVSIPPEGNALDIEVAVDSSQRVALPAADAFERSLPLDIPVRVQSVEKAFPATGSRQNQSSPVYGGGMFFPNALPDGYCSLGFAAQKGQLHVMITAGHCGPGTSLLRKGSSPAVALGNIPNNSGYILRRKDTALLDLNSNMSAGNRYFTGGITSSSSAPITAVAPVIKGSSVCTQGANSGQHCGVIVTNPNTSADYGYGFPIAPLVLATASSGAGAAVVGGDSGGPVVAATTNAVGIISGGVTRIACPATSLPPGYDRNGDLNCSRSVFYAPMPDILGSYTSLSLRYG